MQILVAGASGFIGRALCARLIAGEHQVIALTRDPDRAATRLPAGVEARAWNPGDGADDEALRQLTAQADAMVNLSGESIGDKRWTPAVKARLIASRTDSTHSLVHAIAAAAKPRFVLLNASAVGYYGDGGDNTLTETAPAGQGFLPDLCKAWEKEALKAPSSVRVVVARIGIVLGEGGGALARMLGPFQAGIGGPLGNGRQWVPWVHLDDVAGMMAWALETTSVRGAMNVTAPVPVTMRDLATALGRVLRRPALVPAPAFVLRALLGEFADALLEGQRAVPALAERLGYQWRYPDLEPALRAAIYGTR